MSALITFCHVDNVEVLSPLPSPPLLVVYSVGNAGRKEKLAIERRLLISLPHIVLYNPTEPGPDTAI